MTTTKKRKYGRGPGGSGGSIPCPRGCGNSFSSEYAKAAHVNNAHLWR